MSFAVEHPNHDMKEPRPGALDPEQAELALAELERILSSRHFRNAVRSRQFLDFVVRHAIEGHGEQLKERTIGTEVFHRAPGYATGDDPVVRVQAGEVRRRLEQYYQETRDGSPLRIELPVGSYAPHIRWSAEEGRAAEEKPESRPAVAAEIPKARRTVRIQWLVLGICVVAAVGAGFLFMKSRTNAHQKTVVEQFWAPAFATPQPVLICLAKPLVYRPSLELYQRYARSHPGTFENEVERSNQVLPLTQNEPMQWGQMLPYPDYGVAVGDAYSAVSISGLLGQLGKPSQVRIGTNYSFEDLRNSPDVIIGAFNNKWTMQMMPNLHFAFIEDKGGDYRIREQGPNGRIWRSNLRDSERFGEDYAIVARLLDSRTGQFTVIAAGLTSSGTQTAGEFVSNRDILEKGLRAAPGEWQKKNLELVLETTVTDSTPGPPQVVASYAW